jgi:PAS domain S-box-containing protein
VNPIQSPHDHQEEPPFQGFGDDIVHADMVADLGVWRWDLRSGRVELSERLRGICGLEPHQQIGSVEDFLQFIHPEDRALVWSELEFAILERRSFTWQARINRPDGQELRLQSRGSPLDAEGARLDEIVGVCQDITPRTSTESMIGQLERRLSDIIAKSPAMITIKDLDHRFRMANNDVATLAGRSLAEVIGHTASELFPDAGPLIDSQAAEALATLATIHGDVELGVKGQPRTFHLVSFPLIDHTGAAVEVCCIATDITDSRRQQKEAQQRHDATELIRSALREQRMFAVGQPVVEIASERTVSEELLIRLSLPGGDGLLQPAAFLPAAERFGLIQEVDTWMVHRAIEVAATHAVQVNLSAVTFSDRSAREAIVSALERAAGAADRIVFEITETAAAHHLEDACAFAEALTELGCGLALDDFGTGFGSFTYLRRLPLRYLKIDHSFVTGLPYSNDDRRVVSSIVHIAKQFELQTIAEGVEDAETLKILGELGADFAQGFHLGRPKPLAALDRPGAETV